MEQNKFDELNEWIESEKHLPHFMRDFHDQKDIFKTIGNADSTIHGKGINWTEGHCYTIDKFLKWMALHGVTLQKNRSKKLFLNMNKTIQERKNKETEVF